MVLGITCNYPNASRILIALIPGNAFDCNIVGFSTTCCEYNFGGTAANCAGYALARFFDRSPSFSARGMKR